MNSYLSLVPRYEKVHRKSSRISVLCIVISVLLVTAVFSMADMALQAQKGYFIKTNGEYHISLTGLNEQDAENIQARPDVAVCGWTCQGSTGAIGSKTVSFAGADETAFCALTEMNMQSGTYPVQDDEALLNQSALEQLGLSIGDTVTVAVPDGSFKDYCLTGVLEDMGSLQRADVFGMVLSEDGFRAIADENAKDGTSFRIQFKPGVNIQSSIRQIQKAYRLSGRQVAENTALLGLMGQSKNSTMQSLYMVAVFLVLLILAAGTVMIAASFHTNVMERVQFYGLLQCLGASKKQVKHFVILQGLRQSMKGVPFGLAAGQIVTWGACLLLQSISKDRFSEIPFFWISISGLAGGLVIGFLIVLLASLSPAKKAAKVSPITAVSGNAQLIQNQKAVDTKRFPIEISLGIFHAVSNKKNVFLMTCSFAISIMTFLSFQVLVVFLNQGMPALSPSAADVSITMENRPLDRALTGEIGKLDGVEKTFGRMEQAEIPVTANGSRGVVTLISYEDTQFRYAKDDCVKGSTAPAQNNTGLILMSWQDGWDWNVGDTITIHAAAGEKQVTVAGVLSDVNAANSAGSCGYMVCSEQMFVEIAGDCGYTAIDVQLSQTGDDHTVSAVRKLLPEDSSFSDQRLTNAESQSSYYTGAVFIYGFLVVIALITVLQIFNSMNASVASRTKQYGIMNAIGMDAGQMYKMIAAEAFTYAGLGCVAGCMLGLPLNRILFQVLIADKWGIHWQFPIESLLLIVFLCLAAAAIAIRRPIKQMRRMAIVDIIKA